MMIWYNRTLCRTGQSHSRKSLSGRGILVLLLASLCLLMTACRPASHLVFPDLISQTRPSDDSSATEPPAGFSADLTDRPRHLSVALPIGSDALELLRLYFLANRSGRLTIAEERLSAISLTLDDLRVYDAPLALTLEPVSFDLGATDDQLRRWIASASLPDLLYLDSANLTVIKEHLMDMTNLMSDADMLVSDRVYASLLAQSAAETGNHGLPYLVSTPLLFANPLLFTDSGIDLPRDDMNWPDFFQLSRAIADELVRTDQHLTAELFEQMQSWPQQARQQRFDQSKFVLANEEQLLPWLPSQFDAALGWMAGSGDQWKIDHPAMLETWQWLTDYSLSGLGVHHLDDQQLAQAGLERAETRSGRTVLWFDDSAHLTRWTRQSESRAIAMLAPAGFHIPDSGDDEAGGTQRPDQTTAPLPVSPRYLAVSRHCEEPVLAGQLALLLATDPAALILQSRIQLYEGYFPVVQSEAVWNMMVRRQLDGSMLALLQPRLEQASVMIQSEELPAGVTETMLTNSWKQWVKSRREEPAAAPDPIDSGPSDPEEAEGAQNQDENPDLLLWLDQLNRQLSRLSGGR
ncbi:MAG: hypothetical protein PHP94_04155 [Eubacteriales bacterium]|nr:hypothetical protein [Eubacteriales bacterium]